MQAAANRPRLHVQPTPTDRVVETAALAGLGFLVVVTALYWPTIPDKIPTHFGLTGKVDAWGPKTTLLALAAIGAVMYAVLGIVSRFPHTFNYPVPITEQNAERQYRIALSAMRWIKMECVWMFAYLNWQTIQVALGRAKGLDIAFAPVALAAILVTCIILIVRSYRAR
jgi:uncharacterized membrane protein